MRKSVRAKVDPAAAIVNADPAFRSVVEKVGPMELGKRVMPDHFAALARSICFQQLAGKAAETIFGRVLANVGGTLTPESVQAAGEKPLREGGLSRAKTVAMLDLADHVLSGKLLFASLDQLTDAEVAEQLVQVKGVGPWTAEMFLIFHLRRPDVWPVTDYGVRAGFAVIHKLKEPPLAAKLLPEGERYRPFRSTAAWYCWRALELSRSK